MNLFGYRIVKTAVLKKFTERIVELEIELDQVKKMANSYYNQVTRLERKLQGKALLEYAEKTPFDASEIEEA